MGTAGARRALVGLASTAAAAGLLGLCLPVAVAPAPAPAAFDDLLVRLCAALCCLAVAWLWLGSVVVVVTARRARTDGVPGVPRWWHRAVLAGCGVALVAGAAPPALAAGAAPPSSADGSSRPVLVPGLPLPELPRGRATTPPAAPGPGVPDGSAPGPVVVAPGDSLWSIAARRLGPGASDAEIDAAWRALYARNATAVGPDPDLILPGQRLAPPEAPRTTTP